MRTWRFMPAVFSAAAAAMVCVAVLADAVYAKTRSEMLAMTTYGPIAACAEVKRIRENPVNCVVTDVQGHPTLAVEFTDEPSMRAYFGEFAKRIEDSFCEAANKNKEGAFFVVALKNPRVGSVSSCETGESSGWLSLD